MDFMEWSDYDVERFLERQEMMYGGQDEDEDYELTDTIYAMSKEEWLEWADSLQWSRQDWEEFKEFEMTEQ
jgi:hypothetical protein